jgi:UDP-glucose 4-epimerase
LRYFVTGCAGFIGSCLTDRLLARGHEVVGYDNFSTGREDCLRSALNRPGFRLVRGDLLDAQALSSALQGIDFVFHLAANADVRFGAAQPRRDLEQNTVGTHTLLEAMRQRAVRRIAFASSGAVYGDAPVVPTPEDAAFPVQTSLYAASKAAGEGLTTAYCATFGFQSYIFRFVSILGERYGHGHVLDFCSQLQADPRRLTVLGDGHQRKSYLYVEDCVDGMLTAISAAQHSVNIFNLGHTEYCEVNESIAWICATLGVAPTIVYTGGDRGWAGDNPFLVLDTSKIRALGWRPTLTIRQSVIRTVQYLSADAARAEPRL